VDSVRSWLNTPERHRGPLGRLDLLILAVVAVGAFVLVALDFYQRRIVKDIVEIFDIDGQRNLTTWFHSSILLGAAFSALLLALSDHPGARRLRWFLLGGCLAFFSLDKAIALHEQVGRELVDAWSLSEGSARLVWQAAWSPIILTTAVILLLIARESGPRTRLLLALMLVGGAGKLLFEAAMFPLTEWGGVNENEGWFYGTEVEIEETLQLMAFGSMFAAVAQLLFDRLLSIGESVPEVSAEQGEAPVVIPLSRARARGSPQPVKPAARDIHQT
jgi:hypothetical protein